MKLKFLGWQVTVSAAVLMVLGGCGQNKAGTESSSQFSASINGVQHPDLMNNPLENGSWGATAPNTTTDSVKSLLSKPSLGIANLTVTDDGAHLDLGCGFAQIFPKIMVSESGEFSVDGIYQQGGGAMPIGGFPKRSIHLHGLLQGHSLKLTYSLDNGVSNTTLILNLGLEVQMLYCL